MIIDIYIYNTPYIAQDLFHLESYGALLLQEANQQILRNNLWMIDAYNSTTKVAWSKSFRMRSYGEPRPTNSFSIKMCYKLDNVFFMFFLGCIVLSLLYHALSRGITFMLSNVLQLCMYIYCAMIEHVRGYGLNQISIYMVLLNTLSLGGFPLGLQILGQILCLVLHLAAVSKPRDSAGCRSAGEGGW